MNSTIVAIATAHGIGSISIIRLSGPDAYKIATKITRIESFSPRYATLKSLYKSDGELIDQALVIFFQGPKSFTGEDVVEFQCHGGWIVANNVLKTLIELGARLADPGEFSKRAFINGRLDLTQAEAIASLIEAKSDDAAKILARQMRGDLKEYIEKIRDSLLEILAYSEVVIDYAEEDLPENILDQIIEKLKNIVQQLQKTLDSSRRRSGLVQGYRVAIIGKPNVGKSSLLNALLDFDRAIVSDIAGTTRDTIEEQVQIGTHLIRLVDTAGIRDASDEIERIGIERSMHAIQEADIVICLFDSSRECSVEDKQIISLSQQFSDEKPFICLLNKTDLDRKFSVDILSDFEVVALSCKENVQIVIDKLNLIMNHNNNSDEMMLISTRQVQATEETLEFLEESFEPLLDGELELFSFHINQAIRKLVAISRPYELDEMFDKMFGQFCLGK